MVVTRSQNFATAAEFVLEAFAGLVGVLSAISLVNYLQHFVYVIVLHDVQFGNNWMRKILRTAKIGRGPRPSSIWQSEDFFESNYFQIGQACSPINYIASQL